MSRQHRKRRGIEKHLFITKINFKILNEEKTTFSSMEKNFNNIISSVNNQLEIKKIIEETDLVISMFSEKEEIFKVLDIIETNILGILSNMIDNTPIGIIACRIDYIRKIIEQLPENYNDYGQFACMIYDIIDLITNEFDYKVILENINNFYDKLSKDNELLDEFSEIKDTVISIIENMTNGTPLNIIECRLEYLKKLISKVDCIEIKET